MEETVTYTPEQKRELGKAYYFNNQSDDERRKIGLQYLMEAFSAGDPEATYLVGQLLLAGVLTCTNANTTEHALSLLCRSANAGYLPSRTLLDSYCAKRYESHRRHTRLRLKRDALVDFDGKPIRIRRRGWRTPVDAVLEPFDGHWRLTLSVNVLFLGDEDLPDHRAFRDAVLQGIRDWEGVYEVFNGQRLTVRVEAKETTSIIDSLFVFPLTDAMGEMVMGVTDLLRDGEKKTSLRHMITDKRSFAVLSKRWTVHSRKFIYMQSEDGRFTDYEELRHVAKHEFGHVLGLGDLYASAADGLPGVEQGTYPELDSYVITGKRYNLVMCDHHGPISNNDVEMVLLAFRDNKPQRYQPDKLGEAISEALGKGN